MSLCVDSVNPLFGISSILLAYLISTLSIVGSQTPLTCFSARKKNPRKRNKGGKKDWKPKEERKRRNQRIEGSRKKIEKEQGKRKKSKGKEKQRPKKREETKKKEKNEPNALSYSTQNSLKEKSWSSFGGVQRKKTQDKEKQRRKKKRRPNEERIGEWKK